MSAPSSRLTSVPAWGGYRPRHGAARLVSTALTFHARGRIPAAHGRSQPGKYRTLWTVDDLGEILFTWPAGKRRTRAILAFVAAKDGTGPAEKARQAFLDAAREAGVIVKEGEFPFKRPKPMIPARVNWVRIGDLDPTMKGELHHFVALDGADRTSGSCGGSSTAPKPGGGCGR